MILFSYKPNDCGPEEYYSYDNDLKTLQLIKKSSICTTNGWVIDFRDIKGIKNRIVVFGENNNIFFDVGEGPLNYSSGELQVTYKKWINILYISYYKRNVLIKDFIIFISPWRYLLNDGMFPDDVEPLYAVIKKLQDKEERKYLEATLSRGIN